MRAWSTELEFAYDHGHLYLLDGASHWSDAQERADLRMPHTGGFGVPLRQRIARLQGTLTFTLYTDYHGRLDVFAKHLRELQAAIQVLRAQHVEFVRTRQAAVHSFEGYDTPISAKRIAATPRKA